MKTNWRSFQGMDDSNSLMPDLLPPQGPHKAPKGTRPSFKYFRGGLVGNVVPTVIYYSYRTISLYALFCVHHEHHEHHSSDGTLILRSFSVSSLPSSIALQRIHLFVFSSCLLLKTVQFIFSSLFIQFFLLFFTLAGFSIPSLLSRLTHSSRPRNLIHTDQHIPFIQTNISHFSHSTAQTHFFFFLYKNCYPKFL